MKNDLDKYVPATVMAGVRRFIAERDKARKAELKAATKRQLKRMFQEHSLEYSARHNLPVSA
jgi:hypothetical protein